MAAAAAVLLSYGSELTFFQDSWEYLMRRREFTAAALFDPHNEHIVVLPVVIELLSLRIFGMSSMMPEMVVLVALLLGVAALLFVYVRRRLGPWPALFAATVLLFLGPGWQDLLWPFQLGFAGAALFGIATLLALENEEERWDLAAPLDTSTDAGSFGIPIQSIADDTGGHYEIALVRSGLITGFLFNSPR